MTLLFGWRLTRRATATAMKCVKVLVGAQEAALVWELRRLKMLVEKKRRSGPRAVDVQRTNRPSRRSRGDGKTHLRSRSTQGRTVFPQAGLTGVNRLKGPARATSRRHAGCRRARTPKLPSSAARTNGRRKSLQKRKSGQHGSRLRCR